MLASPLGWLSDYFLYPLVLGPFLGCVVVESACCACCSICCADPNPRDADSLELVQELISDNDDHINYEEQNIPLEIHDDDQNVVI